MRHRPAVLLSLAAALSVAAAAVVLSRPGMPLGEPVPTPPLPVVVGPAPPPEPAPPAARVSESGGETSVTFRDELTRSDVSWLATRPRLRLVHVMSDRATRRPPTDASLRLLRESPVSILLLARCEFTDAGLLHLADHPHLRMLLVADCPRLTGAGVAALLERLPDLESLSLTGFALSARDAAVVFRLPLRSLRLTGCTGEGADRLARWWGARDITPAAPRGR